MATIASLNVLLTATTAPFTKGLATAKNALGAFSEGIGAIASTAFGPIGLAVQAIAGVAESIHAATEDTESLKKLNAVLTATGDTTGFTSQQLQGMAEDLQKVTNFSHHTTEAAMAVLATFHHISGDTFKQAITSAQDLTSIMGGDLEGNVRKLGRALDNPIAGMKALSKLGISFSEQQKASISRMVASGNLGGAQQAILGQLQGKFGGSAQAMLSPWKLFLNQMQDIAAGVGQVFVWIRNTVASAVESVIEFVTPAWTAFTGFLGDALQTGVSVLGDIIDAMAPIVMSGIDLIIDAFNFFLDVGKTVFVAVAGVIADALSAIGLNSQSLANVWQTVSQWVQTALLVIEFGFTHWREVGALVIASITYSVVEFANVVVYWFTTALPGYLSWFGQHWQEVFTDVVNFTATVASNIWTNLVNLWDAIIGLFEGQGFQFKWTGLTEGFKSAITELPKIAERQIGPLEKSLHDQVNGLGQQVGQDFAGFAGERQKQIDDQAGDLRDKAHKTLGGLFNPKTVAGVTPGANDLLAASAGQGAEKLGALVKGSAEAYKAAHSGGTPLDKLNDTAEKQLSSLQNIEANTSDDGADDDEGTEIP